jgi:hypothetical protein
MPYPQPPLDAAEAETLEAFLDYYRAMIVDKATGLGPSPAPSNTRPIHAHIGKPRSSPRVCRALLVPRNFHRWRTNGAMGGKGFGSGLGVHPGCRSGFRCHTCPVCRGLWSLPEDRPPCRISRPAGSERELGQSVFSALDSRAYDRRDRSSCWSCRPDSRVHRWRSRRLSPRVVIC